MDNFDLLYEKMTENYNYLEVQMGEVYERIKENPNDESNYQLLECLINLGKRMLSTLESFVVSYGSKNEMADLLDRINEKKANLTCSLESITIGRSRK